MSKIRGPFDPRLSRRGFLGATAATGAMLAGPLMSTAVQASTAKGTLTAAHWGVMRAVVEDGKFVKAVPFEKDPAPVLPMIEGTPSLVYSPSRIKYPMVRKGFLEKGHKSDTSERGTDNFVRVSWDEALDLVARELKRVKADHGPASFLVGNLGWKSSGRLHNPRASLVRMMHLHGGFTAPLGDYSTGAAQGIMPHVIGGLEVYSPQSSWPGVAGKCRAAGCLGLRPHANAQYRLCSSRSSGFPRLPGL